MVMDADHGSAEQSFPHSEAFVSQGDLLTPAEEPGSSSSLSSSSTGSSLSASFFRVDESKTHGEEKSFTSLSTSGELASKEGINEDFPNTSGSFPSLSGWEQNSTDATQSSQFSCTLSEQIPNDSQPNSEEFCQGSSESTQNLDEVSSGEESNPGSPGSVSTTSTQTESAMQSPLVQVMERPDVTSTYRIPSHVFERSKSTNPAEWSVASNESLFSIQVGNGSFSRDHVFRAGRSGELVFSKSPLSQIPAVDAENRGSDLEEALSLLEAAVANTTKEVNGAAENRNKPKVQIAEGTRNSSSHNSEGSGSSANSCAFPMKKRKKRKKGCEWLCCCFKCCPPCCDCAWPSCSCSKCSPGCCNYTWPSCSCSKYGSSTCCHTWSCCSCSNFTPTCCHCGWPSCSCSKCFQACSPCSCSSWCKPCSCCTWPSCSSCFSCCKWPSCSSCFSCCRPSWHCKWPSCNCCRSCSSCKWPSCPCSSCSLMCCKWPWWSCFGSNCCRSCQFKSPPCCLPNCSGCCCHCTGIDWRCSE